MHSALLSFWVTLFLPRGMFVPYHPTPPFPLSTWQILAHPQGPAQMSLSLARFSKLKYRTSSGMSDKQWVIILVYVPNLARDIVIPRNYACLSEIQIIWHPYFVAVPDLFSFKFFLCFFFLPAAVCGVLAFSMCLSLHILSPELRFHHHHPHLPRLGGGSVLVVTHE